MRQSGTLRHPFLATLTLVFALGAPSVVTASSQTGVEKFPWAAAGLTEREATAHLLDRFTFGPRPGEIDAVLTMGLENWFRAQLTASLPETGLESLVPLRPLQLPLDEIVDQYPSGRMVLRSAQEAGLLPRDEAEAREEMREPGARRDLLRWANENGLHRQGELTHALLSQKIYRAVASENQVVEVLTDFWFNHFNVSLTDPQARAFVLPYERDAIRPFLLSDFRSMLGATARHPAMLLYLDNAQSSAEAGAPTLLGGSNGGQGRSPRMGGSNGGGFRSPRGRQGSRSSLGGSRSDRNRVAQPATRNASRRQSQGLNENYARELLELHTLGVDGGYDQDDIVEVARAFSGWTVVPPGPQRPEAMQRIARAGDRGRRLGLVVENGFLFRPDRHDSGSKTVLGERLAANRGIADGEQVLDIVAQHPSTARHLARKLATRFVADDPPESLVNHLASTYLRTNGSLQAVVNAIVASPEFWSADARRQKIKSPFELAVSSVRAIGARVDDAAGLVDWIDRMGQPLYRYEAPTGYPDRAEAWTNAGSLLTRMNFGLALAGGVVHGVELDLEQFLDHRQPESTAAALGILAERLLPERPLEASIAQLLPLLAESELQARLADPSPGPSAPSMTMDERVRRWEDPFPYYRPRDLQFGDPSELARVAGVLLGSPEFQRR